MRLLNTLQLPDTMQNQYSTHIYTSISIRDKSRKETHTHTVLFAVFRPTVMIESLLITRTAQRHSQNLCPQSFTHTHTHTHTKKLTHCLLFDGYS